MQQLLGLGFRLSLKRARTPCPRLRSSLMTAQVGEGCLSGRAQEQAGHLRSFLWSGRGMERVNTYCLWSKKGAKYIKL